MRVCHIHYAYYPGQGTTHVYEYTKALSQLGHTVHAIVVKRENEPKKDRINNVSIHRISFPCIKKGSFWPLFFFLKASKKLKEVEKTGIFDIVHVTMDFGSLFIPFFGNKKTKYVLKIESGGIRGGLWIHIAKIIIRIESTFFDTTMVLDDGLAKTLFGKKCVPIVPLGVNFETFKPQKSTARDWLGIPADDIVFVYAGSVQRERNIKKVLSAFRVVAAECESVTLLIVGEGDDLNQLKAVAETLNMTDNIIFTGYVDYSTVPDVLNAADIAVSYVPMTPGFDNQPPLKTVEYMACELPTIATNTAGNRVFIQDGYNGILVNDDAASLSEGMLTLINNRTLRDYLKKNCRSSVKEYDWNTIVETKLIPVYERLL